MARYIVAGAPCSGKSTFVRERARRGDLVYDYDTLHQALSNQASHQHLEGIRPFVLAARDSVFGQLERRKDQNAWIITSTRKTADLEEMQRRFDAEVILLTVDPQEAHRRCVVDTRPEEWHDYIDNWFQNGDIDPEAWPAPELVPSPKARGKKMKKKTFRAPIEIKAQGEPGEFTAVFSTLNVVDHDGDVTLPGAFTNGQKVRISYWGHRWGDLPVGRGEIHSDDRKAWVNGRFFMDTEGGQETYKTVKGLGDLAEWSFGYDILDSEPGKFEGRPVTFLRKLHVHEVSPVMVGAGVNTFTESIKAARAYRAGQMDSQPAGGSLAPDVAEAWDRILQLENTEVKALGAYLDGEIKVKGYFEELQADLTQRVADRVKATNGDVLREQLRAIMPDASEQWLSSATGQELVNQAIYAYHHGQYATLPAALEAVRLWAAQPALPAR